MEFLIVIFGSIPGLGQAWPGTITCSKAGTRKAIGFMPPAGSTFCPAQNRLAAPDGCVRPLTILLRQGRESGARLLGNSRGPVRLLMDVAAGRATGTRVALKQMVSRHHHPFLRPAPSIASASIFLLIGPQKGLRSFLASEDSTQGRGCQRMARCRHISLLFHCVFQMMAARIFYRHFVSLQTIADLSCCV